MQQLVSTNIVASKKKSHFRASVESGTRIVDMKTR